MVISSHSILISWESPMEQKLCTANFHVSLTSVRDTGQEIQTEFDYHMITALEPCVTYFGYVSAVDFAGVKGSPVTFNVTTDTGSMYTYLHTLNRERLIGFLEKFLNSWWLFDNKPKIYSIYNIEVLLEIWNKSWSYIHIKYEPMHIV